MKRLFFVLFFVLVAAFAMQGCREEGEQSGQKEDVEERDTTAAPPYREGEPDFD